MAIHMLEIPGWHPAPLNQLMRGHWGPAHVRKKRDQEIVATAVMLHGIPRASGRRRLRVRFILEKGQRAFDPDAPWKSLLDALTACGMICDDNRQSVICEPPLFNRADEGEGKGTIITLEDL